MRLLPAPHIRRGTRRVIPHSTSPGPILKALIPLTVFIIWKRSSVAAPPEDRPGWRDFPSRRSLRSCCRENVFGEIQSGSSPEAPLFSLSSEGGTLSFYVEATPEIKNRIISEVIA